MNPTRLNNELAVALIWLTRLPVRFPGSVDQTPPPAKGEGEKTPSLADSAWAFPVVGAMVGTVAATVFVLVEWTGAPVLLAGVLAIATLTLLTGGLHEDGLADFFDGLGARGSKAEKLAAMRDSRIGAYGVLALIIVFAARVAAVASVDAAMSLVVICAFSRATLVHVMLTSRLARPDGAARNAGAPSAESRKVAAIITFGLLAVWALLSGGILEASIVVLAGGGAAALTIRRADRSFGGYTGDVLGAACLISETAMLVALAIVAS